MLFCLQADEVRGGGGLLAAVYTIYISGEIFLAPLEK